MLLIAKKLCQMNFRQLMDVYQESNIKNGNAFYPDDLPDTQIVKAEQDFQEYLQDFFITPDAVCCVWQDTGIYVSALRLEPYEDGLLLEALETKPDMRGRGYAGKLIQEALSYIQNRKPLPVYSHVGKKNVQSMKVHFSCGFEKIKDHAVYIDGSVSQNAVTLCYQF